MVPLRNLPSFGVLPVAPPLCLLAYLVVSERTMRSPLAPGATGAL